eukprot:CAMPEP_0180340692 /NCGR_PEP_ID=MMETSP0989-20121125/800_1 /TAXON_ID=697907 /ORGANISM="non described non described, Strain CCMP2293" /LENGTH=421 /DNA_ID=CAMNT_0022329423 /DNA_START=6 /DNA_END=1268 /DNA_ORIENTATION=+
MNAARGKPRQAGGLFRRYGTAFFFGGMVVCVIVGMGAVLTANRSSSFAELGARSPLHIGKFAPTSAAAKQKGGGHHKATKPVVQHEGSSDAPATKLDGVALRGGVGECIYEMENIHKCLSSHGSNCTARAYAGCLTSKRGLATGAYTTIVDARHGTFLVNVNDMYIGASLLAYGEWSEDEITVMTYNLGADSVAVDVGANIGAMTIPIARSVPKGFVVAFEPQRVVNQMLSSNAQLNGLANIDVRRAGCGEPQPGPIQVPDIPPTNIFNFGGLSLVHLSPEQAPKSGHYSKWDHVPVESIDSLGLPRLDLVKIDAEGMETSVLRGGAETIKKFLPAVYMEYKDNAAKLMSEIKKLGPYLCYYHDPPLYSPRNFRKEKHNIFGQTMSFNILCLARRTHKIPKGLENKSLDSFKPPQQVKAAW